MFHDNSCLSVISNNHTIAQNILADVNIVEYKLFHNSLDNKSVGRYRLGQIGIER